MLQLRNDEYVAGIINSAVLYQVMLHQLHLVSFCISIFQINMKKYLELLQLAKELKIEGV